MQPIRYGMIGGGQGAFIGGIHRTAAAIAGNWQLVAGAFSSTSEKSKASGADIRFARGPRLRILAGNARPRSHAPRRSADRGCLDRHAQSHARTAGRRRLEAGFDVIIDKPLADSLANARAIAEALERTGRKIALTHTYTGYPLVKQARRLVASGQFGSVRRVMVSFATVGRARRCLLIRDTNTRERTCDVPCRSPHLVATRHGAGRSDGAGPGLQL